MNIPLRICSLDLLLLFIKPVPQFLCGEKSKGKQSLVEYDSFALIHTQVVKGETLPTGRQAQEGKSWTVVSLGVLGSRYIEL